MIRAEVIRIEEFRGIRDLTIEFDGGNFAICGPNGTGKSGIVDALEFALTGNISRLSGKGMGGMSLKDHAPHVDSRNRPDKARVTLTVTIPSLAKKVEIVRTVKDSDKPRITPADPDVIRLLKQVGEHPEFVLSRRELIRYIISTPGDRAKEVQILLRLDRIEQLRVVLQKIANAETKQIAPLQQARDQARDHLLRALELPRLTTEKILEAVNARRKSLGLSAIETLTPTTSFRDGLATAATAIPAQRIAKAQAAADLAKLRGIIGRFADEDTAAVLSTAVDRLTALAVDPAVVEGVTRERFLQSALSLFDGQHCPVCDTAWEAEKLRAVIAVKLQHFEEVKRRREEAERQLAPLLGLLSELGEFLIIAEQYGTRLKGLATKRLAELKSSVGARRAQLEAFVPLPKAIDALQSFNELPADALTELAAIEAAVAALPEPTEQDAARDYLTVCQERLEAYRSTSLRLKQAEDQAALVRRVYDIYAVVCTEALNGVYKEVERDFSDLYRFVNRDDESEFTAQLIPSIGKLGFDVDFYGRGKFPPGAYHSEGHQDSMGLCLYLALMKHLLGDGFTFAVLDDVLMSVDSGHRREVCSLLKERFPNTQFMLTTHDPIWLRHMQTAGLIAAGASTLFRGWNVDHGPTEWDDRDIWQEIEDALRRNDVRSAAGLLRHYLEYASTEICHALRAPVEFRGDARFELGDLLPSAIGRFRNLLKEGKAAAQSWGQEAQFNAVSALEEKFAAAANRSSVEQWQINPAIHYNTWADFQRQDFEPVVAAFRELMALFSCGHAACHGLLYVVPERGARESLRCHCGTININFRKKPKERTAVT